MDTEKKLPAAGTISTNDLRKLGILDEYLPHTPDVMECLKNPRTPSEIMRTKEYIKKWAEERNMVGRVKMFGVEVDCGN